MLNKRIIIIALVIMVSGCSVLPFKKEIKAGHFRFENVQNIKGAKEEYIGLMCHKKKIINWELSKQYLAGEHDLWVLVSTRQKGITNSTKEATINFKVSLLEGKSYILNRSNTAKDEISVWIEEADTKKRISTIVKASLESYANYHIRMTKNTHYTYLEKSRCKQGTI